MRVVQRGPNFRHVINQQLSFMNCALRPLSHLCPVPIIYNEHELVIERW